MTNGTSVSDTWFGDGDGGHVAMYRVRYELGETSGTNPHQLLELEDLGKTLVANDHVQVAESDEHIYHEMFVHPAMVWVRAKRVLVLGGGNGCLVRELLKWPCLERVLVLEPDVETTQLCRQFVPEWVHSLEDPRVDLRHPVLLTIQQIDETFDLILADVDLDSGICSPEMLGHVQEHLNPDGLFVVQTGGIRLGRSSQDPPHVQIVQQLQEAFGDVRVAYEYVPSFDALWTVTVASSHGFSSDYSHLSAMWGSFGGDVWEEINIVLDDEHIRTAYYDGITHMRLFSPPLDQGALYGWDREQGEELDEPCSSCKDKDKGTEMQEGQAE